MSTPEQYLYVARLAPLNQELPVVDPDEGPIVEYFDSCAFAPTATRARDVRLLIDHDDNREAGHFTTLRRDGPWLLGTFVIDFDTTPGVNAYDRLDVGTPISIGFTRHTDRPKRDRPGVVHRAVATLDEASIVDQAAYQGRRSHPHDGRCGSRNPPPTARRTTGHPAQSSATWPTEPRKSRSPTARPPSAAPSARCSASDDQTDNATRRKRCSHAPYSLFRFGFSLGHPCHGISPRSGRVRRGSPDGAE